MIGRPNLTRYNCRRFHIWFTLELGKEIGDTLLEGSFQYKDPDGRDVTLYGKTYQSGGSPVVVDCQIRQLENQNFQINIIYTAEERDKRPFDIKYADTMMNQVLADASNQPIQATAFGTFNYLKSEGWSSDLLPHTFDEPIRYGRGIKYSRMDGVKLTDVVGDSIRGWFNHSTDGYGGFFTEVGMLRDKVLTKRTLGSLLREGFRISSSLMFLEPEDKDAD